MKRIMLDHTNSHSKQLLLPVSSTKNLKLNYKLLTVLIVARAHLTNLGTVVNLTITEKTLMRYSV